MIRAVVAISGSPAVKNGINAFRPSDRKLEKSWSTADMDE
jgi:hypothetical protein